MYNISKVGGGMVKYSLVAKNVVTDHTVILLDNQSLINIDKHICNGFENMNELRKHFNIADNYDVLIRYIYGQKIKYLETITKDICDYNLSGILSYTNGANIDKNLSYFINYVNQFLLKCNRERVEFLVKYGYIDSKVHSDLIEYLQTINVCYDIKSEIVSELGAILKRYINFRRLYMGSYNFENKNFISKSRPKVEIEERKKLVFTEDELLNDVYNNAGLDGVYSLYDLDDLKHIDGIDELNIDGIAFTKKR